MTDPLKAKDRNAQDQGQGPRTLAQVFSPPKKGLQKSFLAISVKEKPKRSSQIFPRGFWRFPKKNFCDLKNTAILEARTGQFLRT